MSKKIKKLKEIKLMFTERIKELETHIFLKNIYNDSNNSKTVIKTIYKKDLKC